MITLLAHHVELQHIPVLAVMYAAGFWIGWQMMSKFFTRGKTEGPQSF